MDALLATFEEELTAQERANPQSTRRTQERVHNTASTLFSSSRDLNPECSFCQQSHLPTSCSSVTDVASRKQILKSSGRCFNCLRKNHISRDCKSSSRCQKCRRKHHTSICGANCSQPRNTSTRGPSSNQPKSLATPIGSGLDPGTVPYQPSTTSSNLCSDNLRVVFLQTACAVIHNPSNSHVSLEIRLLLNSGSQKSYISERARELLHLDAIGEQPLSITTCGSYRGSMKVCPIVNVGICLRGYPSMSLSLYVICDRVFGWTAYSCMH